MVASLGGCRQCCNAGRQPPPHRRLQGEGLAEHVLVHPAGFVVMWPHSLMRRLFSERMLLCSVSHASSSSWSWDLLVDSTCFVRMNIDKSLNTTWFRVLCCSGKRLQVLMISFIRVVSDSRMALSHPLKALVRSCSDTHTHAHSHVLVVLRVVRHMQHVSSLRMLVAKRFMCAVLHV